MKGNQILALLALPGVVALATGSVTAKAAADRLRALATIPDLKDIVEQVGGDRVEASSISRGRENLHAVMVRPSHLVAMSKADLLVEVGLSLEMTFVPGLLESCRNPEIQPGGPGFVNVSAGWNPIDVPASLSRKAGDIHPAGNPHMNMDPRAGTTMATRVFEGLVRVDPESKPYYEERLAAYSKRLEEAQARWSALAAPWKGKTIAVYHLEYNYIANAYAIDVVGALEVKPGIPPTPNHLAKLIDDMKARGCRTILTAPWSNNADVSRVAEATGARIVELPNQCGGMKGAETWIGMMDLVHERLAAALQ